MPKPNTTRLTANLNHVCRHPEDLNQEIWWPLEGCGTACCIAGNTVRRADVPAARVDVRALHGPMRTVAVVAVEDLPAELSHVAAAVRDRDTAAARLLGVHVLHGVQDPRRRYISVADTARLLLGLTTEQAEELFDAQNTAADLTRIVADLCKDRRGRRTKSGSRP